MIIHRSGTLFESGFLNSIAKEGGTASGICILKGEISVPDGKAYSVQFIIYDEFFFDFAPQPAEFSGTGINSFLARRLERAGNADKSSGFSADFSHTYNADYSVRIFFPENASSESAFNTDRAEEIRLDITPQFIAPPARFGSFSLLTSQQEQPALFIPKGYVVKKNKKNSNHITHALVRNISREKVHNIIREIPNPDFSITQTARGIYILPRNLFFNSADTSLFTNPSLPPDTSVSTDTSVVLQFGYLINSITNSVSGNTISYAIAAASSDFVLKSNEIALNSVSAQRLGASPGDTITIRYYIPGSKRTVRETSADFYLAVIVPMTHELCDKGLMPAFPGISDSHTCTDWKAGVPIELGRISDSDEWYWKKYRGTPQAFINIDTAQNIWGKAGSATRLFFPSRSKEIPEVVKKLHFILSGMQKITIDTEIISAHTSAGKATNLYSLFLSLGAVILVLAMVLHSALAASYRENLRAEETICSRLGFSQSKIMKLQMSLFGTITLLMSLTGSLLGVMFSYAVLGLLDALWPPSLSAGYTVHVSIPLLSISAACTAAVSFIFFLRRPGKPVNSRRFPLNTCRTLTLISAAAAFILLRASGPSANFFGTCTACLMLVFLSGLAINRIRSGKFSYFSYIAAGLTTQLHQSFTLCVTGALGCFLIFAVFSSRYIPFSEKDRSSSSGGFTRYITTAQPIPWSVHEKFLTNDGLSFQIAECRIQKYEDASCLNLNETRLPTIIGVPGELFAGLNAFTFVSGNTPDAWLQLTRKQLSDGSIPAVMDESPLKWGLKKKPGDILTYRNKNDEEINLRITSVLRDSVFQGSILIDEKNFAQHFGSGNASLILADAHARYTDKYFSRILRPWGAEILSVEEKLREFRSVADAYTSVFFAFAACALFLSLFGSLAIILKKILSDTHTGKISACVGFSVKKIRITSILQHAGAAVAGCIYGVAGGLISAVFFSTSLKDADIFQILIPLILSTSIIIILIAAAGRRIKNFQNT